MVEVLEQISTCVSQGKTEEYCKQTYQELSAELSELRETRSEARLEINKLKLNAKALRENKPTANDVPDISKLEADFTNKVSEFNRVTQEKATAEANRAKAYTKEGGCYDWNSPHFVESCISEKNQIAQNKINEYNRVNQEKVNLENLLANAKLKLQEFNQQHQEHQAKELANSAELAKYEAQFSLVNAELTDKTMEFENLFGESEDNSVDPGGKVTINQEL